MAVRRKSQGLDYSWRAHRLGRVSVRPSETRVRSESDPMLRQRGRDEQRRFVLVIASAVTGSNVDFTLVHGAFSGPRASKVDADAMNR